MLKAKITSSLARIFWDTDFDSVRELKSIRALKGERLSIQLVTNHENDETVDSFTKKIHFKPVLKGALADLASLRRVDDVAVHHLVPENLKDAHCERTTPGLYPDVLSPLTYSGKIITRVDQCTSTWIEIDIPENFAMSGPLPLTVELYKDDGSELVTSLSIDINVVNAVLPEQKLIFTNWFHCDGLALYYDCDVFSEKHWEIIENFARVARKNGMNMILTPVFTPPLDTAVGGERLTTQLVTVTKENGSYSFDFTLLDRWVDMCDRLGYKYFEISHLFTQWGCKHAPKVMATVDGEYKRIFGWDTDASSEDYITFLRTFLTEFVAHMKKNGNDKRCFYHISDEPHIDHLESYRAAKDSIADILEGYSIMDALSDYDFFKTGVVELPIPVNDHIEPFIENNVANLWTYYCCGQLNGVSNRLLAFSGARNRSIGMQMYKFDIVGFLHWGYNFYNNQFSPDPINPYNNVSGDHWVPAGDTYSVYPGRCGACLESPRLVIFNEGIQDIRAMQLCESFYDKKEIIKEIEEILGAELRFSVCAYDEETMLKIRDRINEMIEAKV